MERADAIIEGLSTAGRKYARQMGLGGVHPGMAPHFTHKPARRLFLRMGMLEKLQHDEIVITELGIAVGKRINELADR